jgi:arylsulfatase A-like enzyme
MTAPPLPKSRRALRRISLALTTCAALVGPTIAQEATAETPPNIVVILADDLGYADLGCYASPKVPTPRLDQLAAEGMRFTQFYAGSTVCAPSRCVLMTGRHTGRARVRGNLRVPLEPDDVTVAEILKEAGYATGLVGKWGLGNEGTTGVPNRQGFDEFFGYLDQAHAHNDFPTYLVRQQEREPLPNVVPNEGKFGTGFATEQKVWCEDLFVEEAIDFVERHRERPFFLYFAPTIPHANNEAGPRGMDLPDAGEFADRAEWPAAERGFAARIQRLDADVGRIVDRIDALGLGERTLILFTSDNGPHREGGHDPDFQDSNGPLRGIKRSLHDGGIRVPTIARWTGHVAAKTTSEHVAGFQDLLATCQELADSATDLDHDGRSFAPTLLGRADEQSAHDWLYWEFYEGKSAQALRIGSFKAIRSPMFDGPIQIFDLANDLGEEADVAAEHPKLVAEVERIFAAAHEADPTWKVRRRNR